MKRITLNIEEENYQAFLDFLKTLSYVSISEGYKIPESHKAEVNERLEEIEKGNMKTRSWEEAKKDIFKK
ncbi:addiction module protein [Halocola ammonii]